MVPGGAKVSAEEVPRTQPIFKASDTVPGVATAAAERHMLVSNTAWGALATTTTVASRFAAGVLVARLLGADRAGEVLYLLWVADFLVVTVTFAFPWVATRFVAVLLGEDQRDQADAVSQWLYRRYLLMAAAGALLAVLGAAQAGASGRGQPVALVLGLYFFVLALSTYYSAHLAGRQEFQISARIAGASALALLAGVIVGAPLWGVGGVVVAYLAASLPGAALSLRCLRLTQKPAVLKPGLRPQLLRYALFAWVSAFLSAFVWSRNEVFFIERSLGHFWVAMFTVGISMASLATQGPMLLTSALMPHFAQLAGAGRVDALRARYATATRLLALMLFPLCFGLSSLMPVLLPFLYGPEYAAAVPSAMVLVAFAALSFGIAGSSGLQVLDRIWVSALTGAVGSIAAVLVGVFLIPRTGIMGAVWSRSLIQTIMTAASVVYLWRRHSWSFPLVPLAKISVAALACAVCSGATVMLFGHIAGVLIAVPTGALVYLGILPALRIIESRDALLLRELTGRLPTPFVPLALAVLRIVTTSAPHESPADQVPPLA
jgi:O-antigen/teichoic acid export membrane protein